MANLAMKQQEAIEQMAYMCASVKALIHCQIGLPYPPTASFALALKVDGQSSPNALGQKESYTIPQGRLGKKIMGECSN